LKKNSQSGKKKQAKNSVARKNSARPARGLHAKRSSTKKTKEIEDGPDSDQHAKSFPVVGIGASAGGLEAFSAFLQQLPINLGMAYIYVQHLSPTHESFLPEILERKTKMPVHKIEENMKIEKDHVYVIPEKTFITVTDGILKLEKRQRAENYFPIDSFFISLATVHKENAIGILLSGTGSDGTLGLKAIKAEGGITFAQDDTAKYPDMPSHAIQMGYVDFVMPPDRMSKELSFLVTHPYVGIAKQKDLAEEVEPALNQIESILHSRLNVDFSQYKRNTIRRRILRRMVLHRLKNLDEYVGFLKKHKDEINALYQDLLITVTNFFRDPGLYHTFTNKILPVIFRNRKSSDAVRIWIPGCATGEEAISLAIVLLEYLGEKALTTPIQLFATDLNDKTIERARAGVYPKAALQNISAERLKKFFTKLDGHYQVVKSIREMIIYAPHNLLKDPPFSRMDIISCQNVLIYLEPPAQNKIMHAFHFALKASGYLVLGKSESVGNASDLFEQTGKENRIYRKKNISTPFHLDFPVRPNVDSLFITELKKQPDEQNKEIDLDKETEKLLLKKYVPASVLVNKDLEILRFRGGVSNYLEPAAGKASLNLMKMVKEDIAYELRTAISHAKKMEQPVRKSGLRIGDNGFEKQLAIEVVPLKGNGKSVYYLIIFKEDGIIGSITNGKQKDKNKRIEHSNDKRIAMLEDQLREARENMKIMTEEFEATREELQTANEEVLSSNEELQSINEELETSKEELQSTNEELTTINEELNTRNNELKEVSDYAYAIIESMHESLITMSPDLRIKRANKYFYNTFQVKPSQTEGFYLYELGNGQWEIPELQKNLKFLQNSNQQFANFEVDHDFPGIGRRSMLLDAQKFTLKDGKEESILLSIRDITSRKQIENSVRESEERLQLLIQNIYDIITILSKEGDILYESNSVERVLGYQPNERIGKNIFKEPIAHPDDIAEKEAAFKKAVASSSEIVKTEFRLRHKDGSYKDIEAVYVNLIHDPRVAGIVANYHDVTDQRKVEKQREEFVSVASHELKTPVTSMKGYIQILRDMFSSAEDSISAELMEKLDHQVDRLSNLIKDLLDVTRIREGKLEFRKTEFEIDRLIHEVVNEMQLTTKKHLIVADLKAAKRINADRERIGQVLSNLISNAIKYSPGADKIIITSSSKGENVAVSVQDFGIGISADMQKKVFDRFFRFSDPAGKNYPGLGLGLYIAAEIVKRHGGTINLTSKLKQGSTFSFAIPWKK
jgi:two-component system CheB/CheR fusion protein